MLDFIRSDLLQFQAYTPHPGGELSIPVDILDTNESPYDLPADLKEKLAWVYQNQMDTNRYPDGSHQELKGAIAAYVNESAATNAIAPAWISLGNGSDELIRSLLIATCIGGAGSIFVADPTFSMYGIIAETLGIEVVRGGRLADFSLDLEAARSLVVDPVRVVFMVHPNSPTGNALTEAELDWLRSLPEHILVVIDEAYFEFSQTTLAAELPEHPNWVILRTFSKAFRLAALRVGYAIAPPAVTQILEKVRLPYNLPAFTQTAALFALQQRDLLLSAIPELLQERDRLYTALSDLPPLTVWPSAANFLYLRFTPDDPHALVILTQTLKTQGTLIRQTGGGLRITIGSPGENERMLVRLQTYLAALTSGMES
ncbi:histidinol-phosphate transaminase [Spirulina major CS-329]|uniref:histidinol-phosphate transaminase n=1 Tax=Spirulina TaxID=1154 RepID=UPI00232CE63E|nr:MULTISPECIES: histidinol-phosphate transaminase [Spirulina]MDB9495744.1 histidinol-phosphate transaminase [Spirulina subsalsa CS-330]MDB9503987.1 histidinol-phosphate transaminase [Spirulina major CS-329]